MSATRVTSSRTEFVLKALLVRLMPSVMLKVSVFAMMGSMITMECAQCVLLVLFGAHQPLGASMCVAKTLPFLPVLVVVSVTLGLVLSTKFVSSALLTTLSVTDTVLHVP